MIAVLLISLVAALYIGGAIWCVRQFKQGKKNDGPF